MSIESWKKEFLDEERLNHQMTQAEAADHAIKKWRGLYPTNLKRHSVHWKGNFLTDAKNDELAKITGSFTCALCIVSNLCANCSLALIGEKCGSPESAYTHSVVSRSPKRIVEALRLAKKYAKENGL